jgi:hypothetical protein
MGDAGRGRCPHPQTFLKKSLIKKLYKMRIKVMEQELWEQFQILLTATERNIKESEARILTSIESLLETTAKKLTQLENKIAL